MVPNGWEKTKLGYLFSSSKHKGYEGLPTASVTLHNGLVLRESIDRRTETNLTPEEHLLVKKDYIAYNMMRAWQGAIGRATFDCIVSPAYVILKPQKNVDSLFAEYLFKTHRMIHNFWAYSYGVTSDRLRLYYKDFKNIPISIPSFSEQQKIAEILSTWNKAITSTENLIANSEMQKKALMQQLLTGKKRLLDENGVRFSGEWKKTTLGEIANIQKGRALSSKDLIDGNYPVIAGGKTSPYNHNSYTHENIITVSASGAYAGYVAYHDYKIWASDCSVISNKEHTNIIFIHQLLSFLQQKIYSLQSGGAQPHIYPKDLNGLIFDYPTHLSEQEKIAQVLSNADREIELLREKLEHLKQEKKALMQQLLTGKRRVVIN